MTVWEEEEEQGEIEMSEWEEVRKRGKKAKKVYENLVWKLNIWTLEQYHFLWQAIYFVVLLIYLVYAV